MSRKIINDDQAYRNYATTKKRSKEYAKPCQKVIVDGIKRRKIEAIEDERQLREELDFPK